MLSPQVETTSLETTRAAAPATLRSQAPFLAVAGLLLVVQLLTSSLTEGDVPRYQCYAISFWRGAMAALGLSQSQCAFLGQEPIPPLHTFPLEYPPLSLLLFSLPLPFPARLYVPIFAFSMAFCGLLIYWLLLRRGPRQAGNTFALYLLLGAAGTAFVRFEMAPALLTLLSLTLAERRRWGRAYALLAVGVLLKYYPLLILPGLWISEQRELGRLYLPGGDLKLRSAPGELARLLSGWRSWRWRNLLLFCAILLGASALYSLIDFEKAVYGPLAYLLARPIQIESLSGSLVWLASKAGAPLQSVNAYGSLNLLSPLTGAAGLLVLTLFALGAACILLQQWQGKIDLLHSSLAMLFLSIATSKVFSPQYLIWLIPLLAYRGPAGRRWERLWVSICLLTTLIYPVLYSLMMLGKDLLHVPGFMEIVTLRNGLFVFAGLGLIFSWFQPASVQPEFQTSPAHTPQI